MIESGQPFTVRDSAGSIVLRDRGSIRHADEEEFCAMVED
jgi:hypothetical protein